MPTDSRLEKFRKNNVKLSNSQPLSNDFQPLRVGGVNTPIQIADGKVLIDGELFVKSTGKQAVQGLRKHNFHVNQYGQWSLASLNAYYGMSQGDDYGGTRMTDISNTSDTTVNWYNSIRHGRIVPYNATLIDWRLEMNPSGTDDALDMDLWHIAQHNSESTEYSGSTSLVLDHLAQVQFDASASGKVSRVLTDSFNATTFSAGDFLLMTARRTSGTDGTFFYVNSSCTFEER